MYAIYDGTLGHVDGLHNILIHKDKIAQVPGTFILDKDGYLNPYQFRLLYKFKFSSKREAIQVLKRYYKVKYSRKDEICKDTVIRFELYS